MKAKISLLLLLAGAFGWLDRSEAVSALLPTSAPLQAVYCEDSAAEATAAPTPSATPVPTFPVLDEPTPVPADEADDTPEEAVTVLSTTIVSSADLRNFTSYTVDCDTLRSEALSLSLPAEGPQILIIHSHSCEAYTPESPEDAYEASDPWRTLDTDYNVVAVGDALASALSEYGLHVIHDRALYDWPDYNSSYANSGAAIESWLERFPDIAVVIDLHRDALGEDDTIYKTVTETESGPAAQLMFVVGTDENLTHPLWRENLKLALTLQDALQEAVPQLMRPINLSSCRYNQQLTAGSLILEVGSSGNSLEEAITAAELFAQTAAPILGDMVAAKETEAP